jgi:hypothetical protein
VPELTPYFSELHDDKGALLGAFVSASVWERAKDALLPIIQETLSQIDPSRIQAETKPAPPEPMADLNLLLEYWDFTYPFTYDVACECCGATTDDWRKDDPRKFRLMAANIGGLVNYQCQGCQARVIKRHFKKHASSECRPFVQE